jgi:uncharacterized protein YndB with AHSA1/START domain
MTRTVVHDTFTLERTYPTSPAQVFAAFSDLETKRRWFAGSDEWVSAVEHTLDFRVGGREREASGPPGGPVHGFDAIYHDIVADARIVYSYTMSVDDQRVSVSLTTVELTAGTDGTNLHHTEHGAYFDGADGPELRRNGWGGLLDALAAVLDKKEPSS